MRFSISVISLATILCGGAMAQQSQATKQSTDSSVFSIVPGTPVYAEATVNDDGSIMLTKVEEISNPGITLKFSFTKIDSGMMLSVKNPLDKTVKYHLDMIDYKGNPHNTSSCPVMAGLSVYESWPHPIPEIRVSNTHVARKNEDDMCIY